MLKVKDYYSRILRHQPLLDIDSEQPDSDFSTSDEDYGSIPIHPLTPSAWFTLTLWPSKPRGKGYIALGIGTTIG